MVHILPMQVSVTDAKPILTDLVRRAEAGEEVVLTRHGQAVARLVALAPRPATPEARRALMRQVMAAAARAGAGPGADAAQEALYDPVTGLPR